MALSPPSPWPTPTPAPTPTPKPDTSAAERDQAKAFAQQWITEHGIQGGNIDSYLSAYDTMRKNGLSFDDARQGAINQAGWGGYGPNPTPTTQSATGGGGGGGNPFGSITGLTDPFTETFTAPTPQSLPGAPSYTAPTFTAPTYTKPDAYQAGTFTPPTADSVLSDPGYKFGLDQGVSTLSNAKAAQGLFGTGSTLKDIIGYGNDYATTKYDDAYGRQLSTFNTNEADRLGAYNTNYTTQYTDPYKFAYQGALDAFAPQMAQFNANVSAGNLAYSTQAAAIQHSNDENYTNAWNSFLFSYNKFRNQQLDTYNKVSQAALA